MPNSRAAAALPIGAQPAPTQPRSKSVAAISGGTYQADAGHTLIAWKVDHFGFSPYTGLFGDITGTLNLDPKKPAASSVDVTIPLSKLATASAGLTAHMLRDAKDAGGKPDFAQGGAPDDSKAAEGVAAIRALLAG